MNIKAKKKRHPKSHKLFHVHRVAYLGYRCMSIHRSQNNSCEKLIALITLAL
jgi:hypothetical protein